MTISPGVYRIRNAETQTIFELGRSEGSGICSRKQNDETNQHWFVQPSGDGVVLKNVESGQYAYIPITSVRNGSKLFGSSTPITWGLIPNGNEWSISLPGSNFIVELGGCSRSDGAGINLWENVGRKYQRWVFEILNYGQRQELQQQDWLPREYQLPQQYFQRPYQQIMSPPIPAGTYFLRNVMSNSLVSVCNGSTEEGAEVSGFECNGGNHQKWQLQTAGYGQNMTLRNVQTSTYLWFRGQSFVPSFPVKSSRQPQEYVIIPANRGFYISPAQQPGYALSLLHGSGQNRTEIAIWHNDQQDNQKWHFDQA